MSAVGVKNKQRMSRRAELGGRSDTGAEYILDIAVRSGCGCERASGH